MSGGIQTARWRFHRRFGRLQIGATLIRHRYSGANSPDRWVLQPSVVFDRKRAALSDSGEDTPDG